MSTIERRRARTECPTGKLKATKEALRALGLGPIIVRRIERLLTWDPITRFWLEVFSDGTMHAIDFMPSRGEEAVKLSMFLGPRLCHGGCRCEKCKAALVEFVLSGRQVEDNGTICFYAPFVSPEVAPYVPARWIGRGLVVRPMTVIFGGLPKFGSPNWLNKKSKTLTGVRSGKRG